MKSRTELEAENFRLRALLVEVRTALLAAGWHDDDLLKRLRQEITPVDVHSMPLAQPKED